MYDLHLFIHLFVIKEQCVSPAMPVMLNSGTLSTDFLYPVLASQSHRKLFMHGDCSKNLTAGNTHDRE